MSYQHKLEWCELCERQMVICGKCGNNTCNGGYGRVAVPNGELVECDACKDAYAFDQEIALLDINLDGDY